MYTIQKDENFYTSHEGRGYRRKEAGEGAKPTNDKKPW